MEHFAGATGLTRASNDKENKDRELLIYTVLNGGAGPEKLHSALESFLTKLPGSPKIGPALVCHHIAGAKNHDFRLEYQLPANPATTIKLDLEFKFGVKSIADYPQLIQIPTNSKTACLTGDGIPEFGTFWVDNYLPAFLATFGQHIPVSGTTTDSFKADIARRNPETPELVSAKQCLKNKTGDVKHADSITNTAIRKYLELVVATDQFDIESFHNKIVKQTAKHFMLWHPKTQRFYYEYFDEAMLTVDRTVKPVIRNGNTLVYKTLNSQEFCILLRWKNCKGICLPAWQIKLNLATPKLNPGQPEILSPPRKLAKLDPPNAPLRKTRFH